MFDIKQQFTQLFAPQVLSVAHINRDLGGGTYAATSMAGDKIRLIGSAEIGKKYYYNTQTHRITEPAPNLTITELPV